MLCCSRAKPDNTFTKYDTWQDVVGRRCGLTCCYIGSSKALGVTPDKIKLVQSDTKYCPDMNVCFSRSHYMNSSATKLVPIS